MKLSQKYFMFLKIISKTPKAEERVVFRRPPRNTLFTLWWLEGQYGFYYISCSLNSDFVGYFVNHVLEFPNSVINILYKYVWMKTYSIWKIDSSCSHNTNIVVIYYKRLIEDLGILLENRLGLLNKSKIGVIKYWGCLRNDYSWGYPIVYMIRR